jgi:hypothetical protein
MTVNSKSIVLSMLLGIGVAAPASAQTEIRPIVIRPAAEHPNCQIYLKADGSRLLFKAKPIAAGGKCPSDYLPGTVTRFGANTYRLRVSGNDCIITPAGLGQCR